MTPVSAPSAIDACWAEEALAAADGHYQAGDLGEAERVCREVLRAHPSHPRALYRLGRINCRAGLPGLAVAFLSQALALDPTVPAYHRAIGEALLDTGKAEQGESCLRRALALAPDDVKVRVALGKMLIDQWRLTEAHDVARLAVDLAPAHFQPHAILAVALLYMGRAREALATFERAKELAPGVSDPHAAVLFVQHYVEPADGLAGLAEARAWAARHADPVTATAPPHGNSPDPERRLRIGYVSPDLLEHPVGRMLQAVLPAHDPAAVEVFCYASRRATGEIAARLAGATDHWRSIVHLGDDAAAELIRADRIDILVDLSGHTGNNRLLLFARKPAPVQAVWLGYFDTTGMASMDYLVADRYVCPAGDEPYYVEQVMWLPDTFVCYSPPDPAPDVTPLPAHSRGYITLGCLNNLPKISPEVIALWAKILLALPTARFCMRSYGLGDVQVRDRYVKLFADRGVAPERLTLLGKGSLGEYLATYDQIDVALDPFPYSGGMTTLDALWMGAPVISLAGHRFVGRMSEGILSAAGLRELVAQSPAEYVEKAMELALEPERLAALRASLRARVARSPLCDGPRFARGLEAAYRQMWRRWCQAQGTTA